MTRKTVYCCDKCFKEGEKLEIHEVYTNAEGMITKDLCDKCIKEYDEVLNRFFNPQTYVFVCNVCHGTKPTDEESEKGVICIHCEENREK